MNNLDITFGQSPWELLRDTLRPGSTLAALRFLAVMEGEDEDAVAEALEELLGMGVSLDITALPAYEGSGELAKRLALEKALVEQGLLPEGLPETDPLRLYLEELARTPAAGDPQMLADRFVSGEENVADMLVNTSIGYVVQAAMAMTGKGVLLLDLIQEGSLGLWQSILHYEGHGDFVSHSHWWVDQALVHTVLRQARENGVGQKLIGLVDQYRQADKQLLTTLGHNPSREEIANHLQISLEDADTAQELLRSARMMEQVKQATQPPQPQPEDDQAVENTAYFQMRQRIMELLSTLEETDAQILTLRFGLEGGLPLSVEETGVKLGLSVNEVTKREAAALAKLRNEA